MARFFPLFFLVFVALAILALFLLLAVGIALRVLAFFEVVFCQNLLGLGQGDEHGQVLTDQATEGQPNAKAKKAKSHAREIESLKVSPRFFSTMHAILKVSAPLLLALALSCQERGRVRRASPAFYFWKTEFQIAPEESALLDSLACNKLYVKFLDIGKNDLTGEVEPLASLEKGSSDLAFLQKKPAPHIVPCVFLTNEVFKDLKPETTVWLAEKTARALGEIGWQVFGDSTFSELQFDCDWTVSTRTAYFLFLKKIKSRLPVGTRVSATIRLHQYKFPEKTGVPPVERGMLMCYNTGDLDDLSTENSILDTADLQRYLRGAPARYGLPLDVALPIFSWALVFRGGVFWRIVPGLRAERILQNPKIERRDGPGSPRFEVVESTILGGHFLLPGDELRLESVSPDLLLQAAGMLGRADLADDATLAFFHLDAGETRFYRPDLLRAVCGRLGDL